MDSRENDFLLCTISIVVAHKEELICRISVLTCATEVVALSLTLCHSLRSIVLSLLPLSCASINLCIEVETRKEDVSSHLVCATVYRALSSKKFIAVAFTYNILEFFLNECKHISTWRLWSFFGRNCSLERHISPKIQEVEVVQSSHKTSLSTLGKSFSIFATLIMDIVVGQCDTKVQTIVESLHHRMRVGPSIVVKLWDTSITPYTLCLIGS